MRLKITGGRVGAEQMRVLCRVAEEFGQGYLHLTSRQNVEVPFIKLEDIEAVKKALADAGLSTCACGPRVRTITACQGEAVCAHGLIDTAELAEELARRYSRRELPGKLKIGVTGCHNNCMKAETNDIGVKGGMSPSFNAESCTFCGLCAKACRAGAVRVDKENGALTFDKKLCACCGWCVKACAKGACEGAKGYILYMGGTFGNRIVIARQTLPLLFSEEELFKATDAAIDFFEYHGQPGERFRDVLDRVGEHLLDAALGCI